MCMRCFFREERLVFCKRGDLYMVGLRRGLGGI